VGLDENKRRLFRGLGPVSGFNPVVRGSLHPLFTDCLVLRIKGQKTNVTCKERELT